MLHIVILFVGCKFEMNLCVEDESPRLFLNLVGCTFSVQLDNYELRPGKKLKVNVSVANLRLFVGNIPKSKFKDEIMDEFKKLTGL